MTTQQMRINAIIASAKSNNFSECVALFRNHLESQLVFPAVAVGIEPFKWEIPLIGRADLAEKYNDLKKERPSYSDRYDLLNFEEGFSIWMKYLDEDITVSARRWTDDRIFSLGLSELKITDRKSQNWQLVDDYAAFVKSRSKS